MLCVSIGRGRHKHMIAEYKHLAEQGVKLVELRLDYIDRDVNLKRLLADRPCPMIITCRRERDGGRWTRSEEERQMLLRTAIVEKVDYIDLEDDIAAKVPRYGQTKRIISYHNFRETPANLDELYARLSACDADIVKIATMAHSPHDNVRMWRMIKQAQLPTVGLCMGEIGTPTRILSNKFGSAFTYATFHHERSLAPGQLGYKQMIDTYHFDSIEPQTEIYGVIADPIGHSLSPVIHNAAFQHLKMNRVYVPFRVPREDLKQFLVDCDELGIKGLSVTIPHKEEVIPHLTKSDSSVVGIGAANTIIFKDQERTAYNTDYRAAMDSLERAVGDLTTDKPFANKTVLILGAGGVSKALAYGCKRRGGDVVVTSRTSERATELAERVGGRAVEWEQRHNIMPDILINGTPIGMHPNVDETPYERRHLRPSTIVFDTVYNPESTLLIKEARQQGCTVITGVDMFVGQAALQFKLFTGHDAPLEIMRQEMKRAIGPAKY
ncbi:MAG TPA: shikimate dehydrogenase [Pirellulaceae bacterium]|nr:shikimate dehydrogenase [Pirellulaceae bacterium]